MISVGPSSTLELVGDGDRDGGLDDGAAEVPGGDGERPAGGVDWLGGMPGASDARAGTGVCAGSGTPGEGVGVGVGGGCGAEPGVCTPRVDVGAGSAAEALVGTGAAMGRSA
jgi:hypothetical protein